MPASPPSRRRIVAAAACVLGLPAVRPAHADTDFPTRPVRLLTPFPVGAGPETVARLVADKLSRRWGRPVTVDNRPGANGFLAIDAFRQGSADGHDLIQLDGVHLSAYPFLFKRLPYDAQRDFEPLAPLFRTYFFVAVSAAGPYRRLADLLADARAQPGRLNYGSWSVGNPVHLGSELLTAQTGVRMEHVVYKETSQLYAGAASGELAFALGSAATAGPLQRAGRLRFLAVAAPRRLAAYPDVPTVPEAGGPAGFEVVGWTALAAPRTVPAATAAKLRRDLAAVLAEPDVAARYAALGYEGFPLDGDAAFAAFLRAEAVRYAGVIRQAGLALD